MLWGGRCSVKLTGGVQLDAVFRAMMRSDCDHALVWQIFRDWSAFSAVTFQKLSPLMCGLSGTMLYFILFYFILSRQPATPSVFLVFRYSRHSRFDSWPSDYRSSGFYRRQVICVVATLVTDRCELTGVYTHRCIAGFCHWRTVGLWLFVRLNRHLSVTRRHHRTRNVMNWWTFVELLRWRNRMHGVWQRNSTSCSGRDWSS